MCLDYLSMKFNEDNNYKVPTRGPSIFSLQQQLVLDNFKMKSSYVQDQRYTLLTLLSR